MRLVFFLLRASWHIALLAAIVGGISGSASIALMAIISRTVDDPNVSSSWVVGLFALLCVVVLSTRIVSQLCVSWLTQRSMLDLQMGLCRAFPDSPVKHLEEIGAPRILTSLIGDVDTIAHAMTGCADLIINLVILACGTVYLYSLSAGLSLAALAFCMVGVLSYWYSAKLADVYVERARKGQDVLQQRIQELIDGVKELKMHHARRREFVYDVLLPAEESTRRSQFIGDCLQDAAVGWGRLTFLIAIGLLLFAWPKVSHVDAATLSGYVITILYLMSPLEQIMGWLPPLRWASVSARQIERLGLMLDEKNRKPPR